MLDSASSSGICGSHLEQPTKLQLRLWLNVNQAESSAPTCPLSAPFLKVAGGTGV